MQALKSSAGPLRVLAEQQKQARVYRAAAEVASSTNAEPAAGAAAGSRVIGQTWKRIVLVPSHHALIAHQIYILIIPLGFLALLEA